ncbi:MAG: hypothetical protein ABR503_13375 [Chitinophagaceae bacterium]
MACVEPQTSNALTLSFGASYRSDSRIGRLKKDYHFADLSEREISLCDFAVHLTQNPAAYEQKDFTDDLRQQNLSDEAILDVAC